jgi:hypothetical protein
MQGLGYNLGYVLNSLSGRCSAAVHLRAAPVTCAGEETPVKESCLHQVSLAFLSKDTRTASPATRVLKVDSGFHFDPWHGKANAGGEDGDVPDSLRPAIQTRSLAALSTRDTSRTVRHGT